MHTYVSYTLRLCDIQLPMCIPRNASISSDASFKTVEKQCGRDHNRMKVPEVCDFEGELCNNLIPGLRYLDMFLLTLQADNYRQSSRHHYPAMHPSTLTLIITNSVQPRRVSFFNICICTNLGSFHNANCRRYIGHKMIKLCSGEVNIHLRDSYHPAARSVNNLLYNKKKGGRHAHAVAPSPGIFSCLPWTFFDEPLRANKAGSKQPVSVLNYKLPVSRTFRSSRSCTVYVLVPIESNVHPWHIIRIILCSFIDGVCNNVMKCKDLCLAILRCTM